MTSTLDFSKLETWQTANLETACLRLGRTANGGCNPRALEIAQLMYNIFGKNVANRAEFLYACEQHGFYGSRLVEVYEENQESPLLFWYYVINFGKSS